MIWIGFSEKRDFRVFRGFDVEGNSNPSQQVPKTSHGTHHHLIKSKFTLHEFEFIDIDASWIISTSWYHFTIIEDRKSILNDKSESEKDLRMWNQNEPFHILDWSDRVWLAIFVWHRQTIHSTHQSDWLHRINLLLSLSLLTWITLRRNGENFRGLIWMTWS